MFFSSKKNNTCLNCGKYGHEHKSCIEPITSWGIILIKTNFILKHMNIDLKKYYDDEGIKIHDKKDIELTTNVIDDIKFLLVRRKHSLGFSEFIRGKYIAKNINGIRWLFNQMVPGEIELIKKNSFEELWNYFWGTNETEITFNKKEYLDSREKFMQLKLKENIETDLDFYIDTASPLYLTPEWGFPKGRKKRGETDLECAMREFHEETNISKKDINILKNVRPIVEELTGTNGIKYRHIYYLAELKINIDEIFNDELIMSNLEIGDISFFKYNEALEIIRDYHIEKKSIIKSIINYYVELVKNKNSENNRNNLENEWTVELDL
jgi:8-oxo-dGTP pyrophosphatase MutT (NUDIX family)